MSERVIRFGVGDGQLRRAATWKCWNSKGTSNIYLACRELRGALKSSLHESGACHVAFSDHYLKAHADFPTADWKTRYVETWPKPPDIAPGVTLAYRIITPSAAVNATLVASRTAGVIWIPPPPEGLAVETCILITRPFAVVSSWPGRTSMRTQLVGSFSTHAGDKVWLVSKTITPPEFKPLTGRVRFFKGHSKADLSQPTIRAILFGDAPDGSRMMLESVFAETVDGPTKH